MDARYPTHPPKYPPKHEAPADAVGTPLPTPIVNEIRERQEPQGPSDPNDQMPAHAEEDEVKGPHRPEPLDGGAALREFESIRARQQQQPKLEERGDVGVRREEFDKALDEADLEDVGGVILPKRHRVLIVEQGTAQGGTAHVEVDGVVQHDLVRYDVIHSIGTAEKPSAPPIVALYRLARGTLEIAGEFEIVEKIADEARRNAHRAAINAFAITDEPEIQGDSLASIIRDAKRYRALRQLLALENASIELVTALVTDHEPYDSDALDKVADELRLGFIQESSLAPYDVGGDDAPALREWLNQNPARDSFGSVGQ